jgi:peptidoglycan/xylan/chitin deacetylase (PgdA/CDA1 family)
MAFLGARRRVVALSALVEEIAAGRSPAAGTVCITFDDGYLDTYTMAAPILAKYRLPATVFLATGYVEREETQWADVLHSVLEFRTRDRVSLPSLAPGEANLASPGERARVRRALHGRLLAGGLRERAELLGELEARLCPGAKPPRLTMTWAEVRELARRYPGIEIGGHTRDHVDLRARDAAAVREQVEACAEDVRRELGARPIHFSYPYERWSASAREIVIASGWRSAVGSGPAFRIGAASDRFAMPRVESPRTMTELRFKTSGAYPGALQKLGVLE